MALEQIAAEFKAGKTVVIQPIPVTLGGGCNVYMLDDPCTEEDFGTVEEAFQYLDGSNEHYYSKKNNETYYVTIIKETL